MLPEHSDYCRKSRFAIVSGCSEGTIADSQRVRDWAENFRGSEDEVFILCGEGIRPQALVCAVPYLRDRDIRIVESGESVEDKGAKLVAGIKSTIGISANLLSKNNRI